MRYSIQTTCTMPTEPTGPICLGQRIKFVSAVDAKEAKEEASYFWNMFKTDPLEPMRHYFRTCVVPGAGLGLEG
jgi:hypothetical protein